MLTSDLRRAWVRKARVAALAGALLALTSSGPAGPVRAGHQEVLDSPPRGTYASVVQQAAHDVAIASIQASSLAVWQGELVGIDITVQNLGTGLETFNLGLRDDTDSKDINTITLTLDAGQTLAVGFQWDTSSASSGLHTLSALAALADDQDPGNNSLTLTPPVEVKTQGIILGDDTGLDHPDASFGATLQEANITTQSTPNTSIFIGAHEASLSGLLVRAAVSTQESPNQSIFVANADATFQPGSPLQDPFGQGEVRGVVHLEGDTSSLGAYVQVGPNTHFVESNGSFRIPAPSGTFDVLIDAPGYIPVRVPSTQISPGEVLNLPELTLPFGDANGDGKIDILDLSIAASNFGATVVEVAPP